MDNYQIAQKEKVLQSKDGLKIFQVNRTSTNVVLDAYEYLYEYNACS